MDNALPAILASANSYQALALKGLEIPRQRGAIHHECFSEAVYGQLTVESKSHEEGKLGPEDSGRSEGLIVQLSDNTRRLPKMETRAHGCDLSGLLFRLCFGGHGYECICILSPVNLIDSRRHRSVSDSCGPPNRLKICGNHRLLSGVHRQGGHAAWVSFDQKVAESVTCSTPGAFRLEGDRIRSRPLRRYEFVSFCRLKPGEYAYRVDLASAPGTSQRRLTAKVIVE